jgi:hypothetical protein
MAHDRNLNPHVKRGNFNTKEEMELASLYLDDRKTS